ncbi:glycoside hydrolase [Colletotrichum truncatum]|uniref:Glycoside hydrolase n=1 Tax=Colletotrichum truncatum TaxID=5467 RepID=A0ACC3ZL97_COLTU|nr:glycoside hydrolase [Colletotrichum truncatum]KAF6786945.1 glycoside hydrolase [Colletotrichum truncatum]
MIANDEHQSSSHPHLSRGKHGTCLIVKGKPFLILGGELHNSALSSARYMDDIWPALKKQGFNTLLGSVTWEQIEPTEGVFDFSELDKVILGAREHGMHLVLLWFGSYKNAVSTYVPEWVKKDSRRFPRVRSVEAGGIRKILEVVTPLSEECAEADAKAFGKLLAHLKDFDADHSTVIMVQVENEVGILGDSRDRSALAEAAFKQPVPELLLRHLGDNPHPRFAKRFPNVPKNGQHSWEDVFGTGEAADEAFMAYHFSRYIGKVAASGKSSYPIPLYANVWLNFDDLESLDVGLPTSVITGAAVAGGLGPGKYPSGGPCPHVLDIWRFNAPVLDFIAPDSYLHNYEMVCKDYTEKQNPLFIPEQRRDEHGARRMWLALGTYDALGVSPWGVEFDPKPVGREFKLISQVTDFILGSSPGDRFGFFFDEVGDPRTERSWTKVLGDIQVTAERASVFGKPGPGGGMIIRLADMKFLLVGYGFQAKFKSLRKEVGFTGILSAREMEYEEPGKLRPLRWWNGDEIRGGSAMAMPNEEPDHGEFPIPACIPARTGITEIKVYVLEEDA